MVGLVLVSHSEKIAEGAKELALQMAGQVKLAAAGGTADGRLGTDINKILAGIREVYSEEGVIILFDLGSSYMNAEMAIELFEAGEDKVQIVDAPLVEGAVIAAVEASLNRSREEIKTALEKLRQGKLQ